MPEPPSDDDVEEYNLETPVKRVSSFQRMSRFIKHDIAPTLLGEKNEKKKREKKLADSHEDKMKTKKDGAKSASILKLLNVDPSKFTGIRLWMHQMLSFWAFDAALGFVIIGNAVTLGVETQIRKTVPLGCSEDCSDCTGQMDPTLTCHEVPALVGIFDNCFLGIYVVELLLRLGVYGPSVLKSNWIKFDAFLVFSSLVDLILSYIEIEASILEQLMVVRILRAAKLARALRLMVQFRTLWALVQGLMHSAGTLAWTFLLIMVMLSVFAILGMEVIGVDEDLPLDDPYNMAAKDNFSSFLKTILTLMQLLSFDSIGGIYRPLIKHRGIGVFLYFIGLMLLLSIALMNLIAAIMINSSMDQAKDDKTEMKAWEAVRKAKQMEKLKVMFLELDEDGSGELSLDELHAAPEDAQADLKEIAGTDDLTELFHLLDYDGGGSVGVEEFCDGVLKSTSGSPGIVELGKLVKQCTDILEHSRGSLDILKDSEKGFEDFARSLRDGGPPPKPGGEDEEHLDRIEAKIGRMENNVYQLQSDISRLLSMVNDKMMKRSNSTLCTSSSPSNGNTSLLK